MENNFYLDDFINYLESQKRASNHTVTAYTTDIKDFLYYLSNAFNTDKIEQVNHRVIRHWLAKLMDDGVKARSINRKISTLKTYYKFLMKQGVIVVNPMLKIISPKSEKNLPEFASEFDMQKIFELPIFEDDFEGVRNKLVITLFYTTGIRRTELVNLTLQDIDIFTMQIKVLGKGNKQRTIPITRELIELYKKYLALRETKNPIGNFVFVSTKGNKVTDGFIYTVVKKVLAKVTSQQKKSPHILRHTFATHMLNSGADINAIKEILGHANLSATQVYTHNSIEKLKNTFKQTHPRSGD